MTKVVFRLSHPEARRRAAQHCMEAAEGLMVTFAEPTRTIEQNARLWASLTDVSNQVDWYGKRLTPADWKNVFSASLRKLQVVPNLDGTGFVALGMSTSRMTKGELSELLELIYAFGAERGVEIMDERQAA
jgi:hypothetical protein